MFRVGLLLIIIVCIFLAVTNPGAEAHKQVLVEKLSAQAGMSGFLGELAGDLLGDVDVTPLRYNNYVLFSTMTFRDDTVSLGLLTKVWPTTTD
jgi:hypothetical protein